MKNLLLGFGLLLALPGLAQRSAPARTVAPAPRPPESPYTRWLLLGDEVARLLRRALIQPDDTKALAVLESRETKRLLARGQDLRPAFRAWRNRLPEAEREKMVQRFMQQSTIMHCLDSLDHDPAAKVRFAHNANLNNTVQGLVYQILMD